MAEEPKDWDARYKNADTPWDSGLASAELRRVLAEQSIAPCRALEVGCGTGTNSLFLAEQGFAVTGIDLSPTAITTARRKAEQAGRTIDFLTADITKVEELNAPFEFLFDRGAYHCLRKVDLTAYLDFLRRMCGSGTRYLSLIGNADEPSDEGPPRLRAEEICHELEPLFVIEQLRAFYFEDAGGARGPRGWSCLMTRRDG